MDKKLFNHTGELFILKEGSVDTIKQNYGKEKIYLTHDKKKSKSDTTPIVWYVTYNRTKENYDRTILYSAGISESDFPVYEKVAYSLGYLYDEERLKWIQKIIGYKKVKEEDVF